MRYRRFSLTEPNWSSSSDEVVARSSLNGAPASKQAGSGMLVHLFTLEGHEAMTGQCDGLALQSL
jgi:hypothetical protein